MQTRVKTASAVVEGVAGITQAGGTAVGASPVLIRPDGHVAWAGGITDPELPQALATWFGAATHDGRSSSSSGAPGAFRLGRGSGVADKLDELHELDELDELDALVARGADVSVR
jgi:hypothetical protein